MLTKRTRILKNTHGPVQMRPLSAMRPLLVLTALAAASPVHADVLAYFSFDDASGGYNQTATVNNTIGTPSITLTGGNRSQNTTSAGTPFRYDAVGINVPAGRGPAWDDIEVGPSNGEWVLNVDTRGYEDLVLRWDYRPDDNTPADDFDLEYRIGNFGAWTRVLTNENLTVVAGNNWGSGSYDLSFVDAIEDQQQLQLKVRGLTHHGDNTFVFDNVLLTGSRLADRPVSTYVGFSTYDLEGSQGSDAYTLLGLNVFDLEFVGRVSAKDGASITVQDASFNMDQYNGTHFVEGPDGHWANIVDTDVNTLTLDRDLSSVIDVSDAIRIRKHHTLASVFGADNRFGFRSAWTSDDADEIVIYDSSDQASDPYFYSSYWNRWAHAGDVFGDYDDQIIRPEQGLIINRKEPQNLSFTLFGDVRTGQTILPVAPGYNILPHAYPASIPLSKVDVHSGDPESIGAQVSPNRLRLWDAQNQQYSSSYDYLLPPVDVWTDSWENLNDLEIPAGAAPMMYRNASSGFDWKAQPSFDVPRVTQTHLELAEGTVGATAVLTWPTVEGGAYQIQSSSDLDQWTDVGSPVTGDENENSTSQTVPVANFYRVQVPQLFKDMGDASAAVAIGDSHFAVANDEDNTLRVYNADFPGVPDTERSVSGFLGTSGETDLEGASELNGRVFWIGSHGRNKNGKLRPERSRIFATTITTTGITTSGFPYAGLRDDLTIYDGIFSLGLAAAIGGPGPNPNLAPKVNGLNIEGLSRTADGSALYIGFRNPLVDDDSNPNTPPLALIVPLTNPDAVVDTGQAPVFGNPIMLDLGNRGIRSIEYSERRDLYFISAGSKDGADFALYTWSGNVADAPVLHVAETEELQGLYPEALVVYDNRDEFQLLSDDGTVWSNIGKNKDLPAASRKFRGKWISQSCRARGTNVAPFGTATQSSVAYSGVPERAIDGNTDGYWWAYTTTHTANLDNSWWEVDLGGLKPICEVQLYNRSDCCSSRLSNFRVSIFAGNTEVFGRDYFTVGNSVSAGGQLSAIPPGGVMGDRVRVQLLGRNNDNTGWLSLSEVKVFSD